MNDGTQTNEQQAKDFLVAADLRRIDEQVGALTPSNLFAVFRTAESTCTRRGTTLAASDLLDACYAVFSAQACFYEQTAGASAGEIAAMLSALESYRQLAAK